jgi:hypothetical protein
MLKSAIWLFILLAGFGLMFLSYWNYGRIAEPNTWTHGLMFVGRGEPEGVVSGVAVIHMRVASLPPSARERFFDEVLAPGDAGKHSRPPWEKLLLCPALHLHFSPHMLATGRMPQPGANEILAGCETEFREWIQMGDQRLEIVGVLDRSVNVFAHSYLLAEEAPAAVFFQPPDEHVWNAYVVGARPETLDDPSVCSELLAAFPEDRFGRETAPESRIRVTGSAFGLYTVGNMLMILGGVGLLWQLYKWLALRVRWGVLAGPLEVMVAWPRTWWAIHIICFGSYFLGTLIAFAAPDFQSIVKEDFYRALLAGPVSAATVAAYQAQKILPAAALTLANNFLASLVSITISAFILLGVGLLAWPLMMVLIGIALAPTTTYFAFGMLPHSLVVLLEVEGYIIAAFFALMIPIYLFRKQEGPTVLRRYGRALLLNLKGNLIVFIILAVAAAYEAVEVILRMQMR